MCDGQGQLRAVDLDALLFKSYFRKRRLKQEAWSSYKKSRFQKAEEQAHKLLDVARETKDIPLQAEAHRIAGRAQEKMGNFQASMESFEAIHELGQTSRKVQKMAERCAFEGVGIACCCLGEHERAIENLTKVLNIEQNPRRQIRTYNGLGNAHHGLGQYKKAIEYHRKHLDIAEQLKDERELGRAHDSLGISYKEMGCYEKAIREHEKKLAISTRLGDTAGQGRAYANLGNVRSRLGQYDQAIKDHENDRKLARELEGEREKKRAQGRAFGNLGNAYRGLGKYKEAIEYHKKHLDVARDLDDVRQQGVAHRNLGVCHSDMGQYEEAIKNHEKGLAIAIERNDKLGQGYAYCNRGVARYCKGEYKEAIEDHTCDLKIAEELDDEPAQRRACGNLGNAHSSLGEYIQAIEYHEREREIAKSLGAKPVLIEAYKNLGQVYIQVGELEMAVANLKKSQRLADALGNDPLKCSVLSDLGDAHLRMEMYEEAIGYYKQQLSIADHLGDEPNRAKAHSGLGRVYMELKYYGEAISYHEKDKAISEMLKSQPCQMRAHGNLGDVHKRMGEYTKAAEHHKKFLKMARDLEDKPAQIRALVSLGQQHLRSGRSVLASEVFKESGTLLSELEKQLRKGRWRTHLPGFVETYADCMDAWVAAAAQAGDMLAALRVEEWRRCRSELPYLSDKDVKESVTADELQDIAKRMDASFIVVFKVHEDTLMTWVLSGESGELVYEKAVNIAEQKCELSKWVASATFAEWAEWHRTFVKMRRKIEQEGEDLKAVVESMITNAMRGNLCEELWESIRDPSTPPAPIEWLLKKYKKLKEHFFKNADDAIKELSKLLLEPISNECEAMEKVLQGNDTLSIKPVRVVFFFLSLSLSLSFFPRLSWYFFFFLVLIRPCPVAADLLSTRHILVLHPLLCPQGGRLLCDRKGPCGSSLVFAHSGLGAEEVVRHSQQAAIIIRGWSQSASISSGAIQKQEFLTKSFYLQRQALLVFHEDSIDNEFFLLEDFNELKTILPAEILSGSDATKEAVIKRMTSGSASLIHLLVHGTQEGRPGCRTHMERGTSCACRADEAHASPRTTPLLSHFEQKKKRNGQGSVWPTARCSALVSFTSASRKRPQTRKPRAHGSWFCVPARLVRASNMQGVDMDRWIFFLLAYSCFVLLLCKTQAVGII